MALEKPNCPLCRTEIGLRRALLLQGKVGIKCSGCGHVLKADLRLRVIILLLIIAGGLYVIYELPEPRQFTTPAIVFLSIAVIIISQYISAHFVRFEVANPGEVVKTDGVTESEEQNRKIEDLVSSIKSKPEPQVAEIPCKSCGTSNPETFETCWNCGQEIR